MSSTLYINATCPDEIEFSSPAGQDRDPTMLEWFYKTMEMRSQAATMFPALLEEAMRWAKTPHGDHREGKDKFYALKALVEFTGMPAPTTNFAHIKSETEVKHQRKSVKPAFIISRSEALEFAKLAVENDKEEEVFKIEQRKKLEAKE